MTIQEASEQVYNKVNSGWYNLRENTKAFIQILLFVFSILAFGGTISIAVSEASKVKFVKKATIENKYNINTLRQKHIALSNKVQEINSEYKDISKTMSRINISLNVLSAQVKNTHELLSKMEQRVDRRYRYQDRNIPPTQPFQRKDKLPSN